MNQTKPHELTEEEIQKRFLSHIWAMVRYWQNVRNPEGDRLEGLAFSILVALDGEAVALPKFIVAPDPHPDDKDYHRLIGDDWYPENNPDAIKGDIAGSLHEQFLSMKQERG